jgi:hypothetical protein
MLKDLTNHITKDEEYPAARGGFGEIWKCTYRSERGLVKVRLRCLFCHMSYLQLINCAGCGESADGVLY